MWKIFCFYAVVLFRFCKQTVFEADEISKKRTQITSILLTPAPCVWLSGRVGKKRDTLNSIFQLFSLNKEKPAIPLFILYDKGNVIYFLSWNSELTTILSEICLLFLKTSIMEVFVLSLLVFYFTRYINWIINNSV